MPFKVKTIKTEVQVLGTSFNLNGYNNEEAFTTTLIEGAVKINSNKQSVILKPGQQAQTLADTEIHIVEGADLKQVMAWKNGYFDFNNADLRMMMRQLERWYDIQVVYEGNIPEVIFKGKMDRNVQLSDVVRFLKLFGIKARLEERVLIIAGK
jgi:ferric-dicitrate binding protein FerR (iron transport regulator)